MSGSRLVDERDYRGLLALFNNDNENDSVKRERINRWKQIMNSFTWTLRYLPGAENEMADNCLDWC
jgi:hypothetical protein